MTNEPIPHEKRQLPTRCRGATFKDQHRVLPQSETQLQHFRQRETRSVRTPWCSRHHGVHNSSCRLHGHWLARPVNTTRGQITAPASGGSTPQTPAAPLAAVSLRDSASGDEGRSRVDGSREVSRKTARRASCRPDRRATREPCTAGSAATRTFTETLRSQDAAAAPRRKGRTQRKG